MTLIKRIDRNGSLYMTWVEITPTHAEVQFYDHEPTEAEAQTFVTNWLDAHLYDDTPTQQLDILDHNEAIENAVVFIRNTANLTLTKWNTYLGTLPFVDKYAIQWFIMAMANRLAEMGEIDLGDYTELQILARMKTWLTNTPARRIRKIFYGE
ncbi:MAG TPA: hypothetical protein PLG04_10730 [Anaerolineaceae bacterium]|nr:hypothetical protein [Anaerolineaceae bacterium]